MWRTNDSGRDKALARAEIPSGGFAEASNHFAATTRRPVTPRKRARASTQKPTGGQTENRRQNEGKCRHKTYQNIDAVGADGGGPKTGKESPRGTLRRQDAPPDKKSGPGNPRPPLRCVRRPPKAPAAQRSHRVWLRSRAERDLTFRRTAPQWTVIEKAFIRSLSRSALASSSAKSDSKVTDSPRRSAIMV